MNIITIKNTIKLIGLLEILVGGGALLYTIALPNVGPNFVNEGLLTSFQLSKLIIFYLLFCIASFMIAYGLFKLKEWSRKLLLIVTVFLLLRGLFPILFSFIIPNLVTPENIFKKITKTMIFVLYHCFIIYFFTRPKVKEQFK